MFCTVDNQTTVRLRYTVWSRTSKSATPNDVRTRRRSHFCFVAVRHGPAGGVGPCPFKQSTWPLQRSPCLLANLRDWTGVADNCVPPLPSCGSSYLWQGHFPFHNPISRYPRAWSADHGCLYARIMDSWCTHDQTRDFAKFREHDPSQSQPVAGTTWHILSSGATRP